VTQFSVLCTVVGGKLKLFDRDGFDAELKQFMDGEELELHLESVGLKYTRAQEKFFHGPVLKAFQALGYHKQEAKDMLALMFIPREVRQMDGTIAIVPGHTSALTKKEYAEFLDQCVQLAAEENLYIEDADKWRAQHDQVAS